MVEQLTCNQQVEGSIPFASSMLKAPKIGACGDLRNYKVLGLAYNFKNSNLLYDKEICRIAFFYLNFQKSVKNRSKVNLKSKKWIQKWLQK